MFIDAAKVAAVANRARVDADDARGVEYLRSKGMQVNDKVDKSLFAAKMAPVLADFDRQFGKENIDRIRNFR